MSFELALINSKEKSCETTDPHGCTDPSPSVLQRGSVELTSRVVILEEWLTPVVYKRQPSLLSFNPGKVILGKPGRSMHELIRLATLVALVVQVRRAAI